jgi:hypothetical protein
MTNYEAIMQEIKSYDATVAAEAIHGATHLSDPFHWVEQNTLVDGKHNVWAKATVVTEDQIAKLDEGTIRSYRNEMPKDANAAHLALSIASLGLGSKGEFSVMEATGLMFSVYEAELGGYNPKFAAVHEIFSSEMPYASKIERFKEAAAKLDLREEFAMAWFKVLRAKGSVDSLSKDGVMRDGLYVMQNVSHSRATASERLAVVPRLLAKAMKLLAQGQVVHPLMLNLDRARVENYVWVKSGEGSTAAPVAGPDGEIEGRTLSKVIDQFASAGCPGAVRLRFFMNHVLPVLRAKGAKATTEAEDSYEEFEIE